jgi:DNA-binding transcriptional ArsR family regulator
MNLSERTRLDLLDALAQLSRIRPEWRMGQTLANLAMTAGHLEAGAVWDLEDAEALEAANSLIEQHTESQSTVSAPVH